MIKEELDKYILESNKSLISEVSYQIALRKMFSRDGPPNSFSDNGEKYNAWCSDYYRKEGESEKVLYRHSKDAINSFLKFFMNELIEKQKQGFSTIVWRTRPQVSYRAMYPTSDLTFIDYFFFVQSRHTYE